MNCFECGKLASENHHVVPKSRGGTKTIPLCAECHGLVHNIKRSPDLSALIKEGLKRSDKKLGRPKSSTTDLLKKHPDIVQHLNNKESIRRIASIVNKSKSTVQRVKKEYDRKSSWD